uniref:RING-type domain-containing protein n=1 Tax=Steinernema glaseri TaxID=37863 RepID=A0A1I8A3T8_9BILA
MADQNPGPRVDYYCHLCHRQFHTPGPVQECTRCGDGFIEQIPRPDSYPEQFMPQGFSVIVEGRPSTSAPNAQAGQQPQQPQQQQGQPADRSQPPPFLPPSIQRFHAQLIQQLMNANPQAQAGEQPPQGAQQPQQPNAPPPGPGTRQFVFHWPGFNRAPQQQGGQQQSPQAPPEMPQMPGPTGVSMGQDFIQNLFQQLQNFEVDVDDENVLRLFREAGAAGAQGEEPGAEGDAPGAGNDPNIRRTPHGITISMRGGPLNQNALMEFLSATLRGGSERQDRVSDADIERLPLTKITAEHGDKQCTTCMDNLHEGDEVGRLNCGHMFHRPCIVPWLQRHNTCPVCRAKIEPSKWVLQQMQENDADLD